MAKKKSHKTTKTKKRSSGRRMGAISLDKDENLLTMAAGVIVGGIGKRFIDTFVSKQDTINVEQKTIDMIEFAGAATGFYFVDAPFIRGAFLGIASAAAISALQEMDMLKGVGMSPMVPFKPRPLLNGVTRTPAVAAATNAYGFPSPSTVGNIYTRRRSTGGGN